jgi:hypothetical protein
MDPRDFVVQLRTQFHGRLKDGQALYCGIEVQLIPPEPHFKQWYTWRFRSAENDRLLGEAERCTGHGPRT